MSEVTLVYQCTQCNRKLHYWDEDDVPVRCPHCKGSIVYVGTTETNEAED